MMRLGRLGRFERVFCRHELWYLWGSSVGRSPGLYVVLFDDVELIRLLRSSLCTLCPLPNPHHSCMLVRYIIGIER
jgi:hypothetical protein